MEFGSDIYSVLRADHLFEDNWTVMFRDSTGNSKMLRGKVKEESKMATLRKDSFTERKPKGDRGRSSFYGIYRHTGIRMTPPKIPFTAAIDDVYGTHVVFGDESEP